MCGFMLVYLWDCVHPCGLVWLQWLICVVGRHVSHVKCSWISDSAKRKMKNLCIPAPLKNSGVYINTHTNIYTKIHYTTVSITLYRPTSLCVCVCVRMHGQLYICTLMKNERSVSNKVQAHLLTNGFIYTMGEIILSSSYHLKPFSDQWFPRRRLWVTFKNCSAKNDRF